MLILEEYIQDYLRISIILFNYIGNNTKFGKLIKINCKFSRKYLKIQFKT